MLNLYRDETFRSNQIALGKQQAEKFSWEIAVEKVWSIVHNP
jgi:hypothetical protein